MALNIRCRIIIGIKKGTIILTTTHIMIVQHDVGMLRPCRMLIINRMMGKVQGTCSLGPRLICSLDDGPCLGTTFVFAI